MQAYNTAAPPIVPPTMCWQNLLAHTGEIAIAADRDGRVLYLNPLAELLSGKRLAEATCDTADEVLGDILLGEIRHQSPPEEPLSEEAADELQDEAQPPIAQREYSLRTPYGASAGVLILLSSASSPLAERVARHLRLIGEINALLAPGNELLQRGVDLWLPIAAGLVAGLLPASRVEISLGEGESFVAESTEVATAGQGHEQGEEVSFSLDLGDQPEGRITLWTPQPLSEAATWCVMGAAQCLASAITQQQEQLPVAEYWAEDEVATARLAAIVDSSQDAIFSVDINHRITSWNRGAEQLFGYTASEVVGHPLALLIPPDRQQEQQIVYSRLTQGKSISNFETVRLHKDGTCVDISLSVAPLYDRQGRVVGISKIARDITQHKRAIERLLESEERLRSAIDVAQLGTISLDFQADTATPDTTAAHMFGLKPHEAVAIEQLRSRFATDDSQQLGQLLCESLAPVENSLSQEHRVRLPDGTLRWLNLQQRNFYIEADQGIRPVRGILAAIDITERKQFEQSLQQAREAAELANRSRGEFLANMSHEIRTPLTAILGHADILSEHLNDPDQNQALETIRRNGRFLLEIVNDILDLSKIDAGRMEVERQRVRPEVLLGDIRSLMDVRARERQVELEFEFDGCIPATIETDAIRLRQILINLIGNGLKFTDQGGVRVVARYLHASNEMQLEIIDTGIGIAPDDIARLFHPFTQVESANTSEREQGGTGLGLAISRRLARALGGDITVRSELGKGSTFQLTVDCGATAGIPLITPHFHISEQPLPREIDCRIEGCILVVDDRRDIRFLAQHLVEKAGGTVVFATNGQEALDLVLNGGGGESASVDLVLLDMQMPVMDGYQAATALRRRGFDKPIIALTASAMKEDREKCLLAGCNDYIAKPLDSAELIRTIDNHLRARHRHPATSPAP